jgi:hypothetical protein
MKNPRNLAALLILLALGAWWWQRPVGQRFRPLLDFEQITHLS